MLYTSMTADEAYARDESELCRGRETGDCTASVDGYCIGGTSDGRCLG